MKEIGVALIGYNFMGRAHSSAYRQLKHFFQPGVLPRLKVLCGRNAAAVAGLPEWWLCLTVTCLAAMVYVSVAVWMTNRPTVHNSR